jgi:hypothetical protein
MTAFSVDRLFHFDQFLELMLHFLDHVGSCVKEKYCATAFEVAFMFVRQQSLDADSSSIQNIHDPVENGKFIVGEDL